MPTLEELFKSKQLASQNGQTAEVAFDIQNSKKIRISSSDPLVNVTGMLLARGARKLGGIKGSESRLEEELTGLRIIRFGSIPVIYGTELPRLLLKTTEPLAQMKLVTSGALSDLGSVGGAVASAVSSVKSTLGLPTLATPTHVATELGNAIKYSPKRTSTTMIQLGKIKDAAAGSLLGQLLAGTGGGNLKTLGAQALGGALKLGKKLISKKLFGNGERTGLKIKGKVLVDGSVTGFTKSSSEWYGHSFVNYGNMDGEPVALKPNPLFPNPAISVLDLKYTQVVRPDGDTPEDRLDLSLKQQLDYEPLTEWRNQGGDIAPIRFSTTPDRVPKFTAKADLVKYDSANFIESKRGMTSTSDIINNQGVFSGTSSGDLDDNDFVPLKFYSIYHGKTAQFRSTISGLSETFSPGWDSNKFVGNPFNYYTYTGIERGISFSFKTFSLNAVEHKIMWDKLNFLTSLVYPQGYYNNSAVAPPFIRFSLGDLFDKRYSFIESLSYTYEDTTPWQVENSEVTSDSTNVDMKGYKLPMMVTVNVGLKFLESRGNTGSRKFYTFTPQTS